MVNELVDFFLAPLRRVDIHQVVAESIDAHEDDIIDLNQSQLAAGQLADGSAIKPFYKPVTIAIKKARGQTSDHVTLRNKGDFYQGFYTKRVSDGTEVLSRDPKNDMLEAKYTVDIFGLSVASKEQLSNRLRPTIQDKFNQAMQ
ncbi:hypothetical protein GCM10028805_22540 [Spirosoma harenae]